MWRAEGEFAVQAGRRARLVVAAGVAGKLVFQRRERWLRAFGCSALFIVGLLTTMAARMFFRRRPERSAV
jgi:hypothetical protein